MVFFFLKGADRLLSKKVKGVAWQVEACVGQKVCTVADGDGGGGGGEGEDEAKKRQPRCTSRTNDSSSEEEDR